MSAPKRLKAAKAALRARRSGTPKRKRRPKGAAPGPGGHGGNPYRDARGRFTNGPGTPKPPAKPAAKTEPPSTAPSRASRKAAKLAVKRKSATSKKGRGPSDSSKAYDSKGFIYKQQSRLVKSRIARLQTAIPEDSRGRITMGVAIVENAHGVRSVLVSTSERNGYLRRGVVLKAAEIKVSGTGHAEANIIAYARSNNLKVIDIGATRPVCVRCQGLIGPTRANISTPLKKRP